MTPEPLHREVESFLYAEARLLEQNRFDEWLTCIADGVRYWMPVRESVAPDSGGTGRATTDAADIFALFDDDRMSLQLRVLRIQTGTAHAEVPASVTQRLITNVMVQPPGEVDGQIEVHSNFMVYQERRGLHGVTFFGRREDVLQRREGKLRIASRKIELAQAVLPATISIFF